MHTKRNKKKNKRLRDSTEFLSLILCLPRFLISITGRLIFTQIWLVHLLKCYHGKRSTILTTNFWILKAFQYFVQVVVSVWHKVNTNNHLRRRLTLMLRRVSFHQRITLHIVIPTCNDPVDIEYKQNGFLLSVKWEMIIYITRNHQDPIPNGMYVVTT